MWRIHGPWREGYTVVAVWSVVLHDGMAVAVGTWPLSLSRLSNGVGCKWVEFGVRRNAASLKQPAGREG